MTNGLSPSEQIAFSTIRIEAYNQAGDSGVGTGFFFDFATQEGMSIPAIITNKHVVGDNVRAVLCLTRADRNGQPEIGSFARCEVINFRASWIFHPDPNVDLCALPIADLLSQASQQGQHYFFRSLNRSLVALTSDLAELSPSEEVVMVGYPIGIWDSTNNMPIFRRGVTATHPNIDYEGRKEFMIDAACFPGSSGSPIFLLNIGNYTDKWGEMIVGKSRFKLLGVIYAGPMHTVEGEINVVPIPTQTRPVPISRIPSNLGFVIKAERLLEFDPVINAMIQQQSGT